VPLPTTALAHVVAQESEAGQQKLLTQSALTPHVAPKPPGGSHLKDTELQMSLVLQQSSVFVHFCAVCAQHAPAHVLEQQSFACEHAWPFAMHEEDPLVALLLEAAPPVPSSAG